MNKILLFILLLFSLPVIAQKDDFCSFDFSQPESLYPSVTPLEGAGARLDVVDSTFTSGPISIYFTDKNEGVQIHTIHDEFEKPSYSLRIPTLSGLVFKSDSNVIIKKILYSDDCKLGDLSVIDSDATKGSLDFLVWEAHQSYPVNSIGFINWGYRSKITKVTVYYTTPTDILNPSSVSIKNNTEIPEFSFINLVFDKKLSAKDTSNIKIFNSDSTIVKSLKAEIIENTIKLFVDTTITQNDTYTIHVPAKSFESADGYHNAELKYTFTVKTPKNTFNYTSLSHETGRVESILPSIILTYPTVVEIEVSKPIRMFKDGEYFGGVKLSKVVGNDSQVMLEIQGYTEPITDLGVYTIEIPEATIYNNSRGDEEFERYNPAFTLEYIISNDPPEDTEVMKAAKALLLKSGLGYPKETSAKRLALKALTEAEDIPADDQLTAAIGEFYNETDVVLPDSGVWYTIASVNANGDKLYLYYNDGAVTLTDDVKKATAFMADSLKTSTSFKTIDGKYLHVLSAAQDGKFDATSSKNVTETYDSLVNNLVLAKLAVKEVDSVKTFGLFSLYGSLGKDIISEVPMSTYAQISHTNKTVISDPNYPLLYTENNTGAFVLEQTEKPEILAEPVKMACSLNPSIVADNSELITLSFVSDTTVHISTDTAAYIAKKGSDKKVVEEVVFTGVSNNSFTFAVAGLENGNYELVIPDGLFYVMTEAGLKAFVIPENSKLPFSIGKQGSGDDEGFDYSYGGLFIYNSPSTPVVNESFFENFILAIYTGAVEDGIEPDTTKQVIVAQYFHQENIAFKGHFRKYIIQNEPDCSAIKLIIDERVGKFVNGEEYTIFIDRGTFGNLNFGKYLNDRTAIKAFECRVNESMTFTFRIDNSISSGINAISPECNSVDSIYDLFGRKLDKITKNGIYIINGKKVVVRNKSK